MTLGKYGIVIDVNGNGQYDVDVDAPDDGDVEVTAGFVTSEYRQAADLPRESRIALRTRSCVP